MIERKKNSVMWPCVLTVAGSDSGGGAGIQGDLKTFAALHTYGLSAITAITAQNTQRVSSVFPVPAKMVGQQMSAVLDDFPVKAIKLGMLCDHGIVAMVIDQLGQYPDIPVVLDPVVMSSSGQQLLSDEGLLLLIERLLPRVALLTPNVDEVALILGVSVETVLSAPEKCAQGILGLGCSAVLLKGGHRPGAQCEDLLIDSSGSYRYSAERVNTKNTHGTGCTLSAAIAAAIAKDRRLSQAVGEAKKYLQSSLLAAKSLEFGRGYGPLQHFH
ncbi:MAG: bifunctional hydroxymethylpyrimidine kinase/phosphomethylpyrimidine kinase [Motiliproteus sp.]